MDLKYLKELYEDEYNVKISLSDFAEMLEVKIEELIRDEEL